MIRDYAHWEYVFDGYVPYVVGDDGSLVKSHWEHYAIFFNDQYESIDAAKEVYEI